MQWMRLMWNLLRPRGERLVVIVELLRLHRRTRGWRGLELGIWGSGHGHSRRDAAGGGIGRRPLRFWLLRGADLHGTDHLGYLWPELSSCQLVDQSS